MEQCSRRPEQTFLDDLEEGCAEGKATQCVIQEPSQRTERIPGGHIP